VNLYHIDILQYQHITGFHSSITNKITQAHKRNFIAHLLGYY